MKSDYKTLRNAFLAHYADQDIFPNHVFAGPIRVIVSEWMRELCYSHRWGLHEFLNKFEKDCI